MKSDPATGANVEEFISRWTSSGAAERANYQIFLSELCDVLGVPRPDPTTADDSESAYVFERPVTFHHPDGTTSPGRIDLYRRGCFVLEAKQGVEQRTAADPRQLALSEAWKIKAKAKGKKRGTAMRGTRAWDDAMLKARSQAEQYARALSASEGRPPLLIVVDVGHSIELYSEFTRTGGAYVPFPDPRSHRLLLDQLRDQGALDLLRQAWTDPLALDPTRRSARVTQAIAESLGRLAQSLEAGGHAPEAVAAFLMRALFTMFAEDVGLLPKESFVSLLRELKGRAGHFVPMVEELWGRMNTGGMSTALRETVLRFNGGLFQDATALALSDDQLELLIEASRADWREVEPAIFGTLLERALDPIERHKLGAHYTPRAYVERLVVPTIVEPLRQEWDAVQAAALTFDRQGKPKDAAAEVQRFHRRLCGVTILDPACGSGNFLYVTLEHLKRLEGEILNALDRLDSRQAQLEMAGFSVDPHQLLGLEVNPRAAVIAELVLWIGYLQWHFRTRGNVAPPEPIIRNFHNIECRDAVLAWDRIEPLLDDSGEPVMRWDGHTMKNHPVTGEEVPDEAGRRAAVHYVNPRSAEWPPTEFIVGNPPFIGTKRMRDVLGHDYTEAVRAAHPDVPESADYVMYWWNQAATLVRKGRASRFGFITTNSVRQSFNRRVLDRHLGSDNLSLRFAIPDHPWVDAADGAAVRIAMTVADRRAEGGVLKLVGAEEDGGNELSITLTERSGIIAADLTVGANVAAASPLTSNAGLCGMGVALHGAGFIVEPDRASALRMHGAAVVKAYLGGSDLVRLRRERYVIDLSQMTEDEALRANPAAFQHVLDHVKPERMVNNRDVIRRLWWRFGWERPVMRKALRGLRRFIATTETSKHRIFQFVDAGILPDHMIVVTALEDAFFLGVMSSRTHLVWSLAAGGTLEDRPRYNKTRCFDPFPFPQAAPDQEARIRALGDALDAHRKRQQAEHPKLTLTDVYNVLEKLRAGTPLNAKDQNTHEQGLISLLRQIHEDLDAAVAEAYGLPVVATDDEIITQLVALNAERAAEERSGRVRWLRPEFQNSKGEAAQADLGMAEPVRAGRAAKATARPPWPKTLAEQAHAVRTALTTLGTPADAAVVAKYFKGARADRIDELLATLASLGQARVLEDGRFLAA